MNPQHFYSHGKLLLCGEYAVLDGATGFALPCRKGQDLNVEVVKQAGSGVLKWKSLDAKGKEWFSAVFQLPHMIVLDSTDGTVATRLVRLLINAKALNPQFLQEAQDIQVTTRLEFGLDEGLGSSSTLVNNLAKWAGINPYALHFSAFKGSGYDIAVANEGKPLLYTMNGTDPKIEVVEWKRNFTDKLYFVHLNKKQDSHEQIASYKHRIANTQVAQISRISRLISVNEDYFEFCLLLELAENEISLVLGMPTIKQRLFSDFHGTVKSLGAWGGDYVLATGTDTVDYFTAKGYDRIISYKDMIAE